jgi:hypothetical protein
MPYQRLWYRDEGRAELVTAAGMYRGLKMALYDRCDALGGPAFTHEAEGFGTPGDPWPPWAVVYQPMAPRSHLYAGVSSAARHDLRWQAVTRLACYGARSMVW